MEEVVGRDAELASIEEWLGDSGLPTLLIEGDAGIGKTTLWRRTVVQARDLGFVVLASVPTEHEARLPYSGLGDVLGAVAKDVGERLPSPQRRALETALLLRDPGERPPDERAVAVATLAALREAGSSTLVAVDDAQWLDRSSAAAFTYAMRRIEPGDGIHVLIARRAGHDSGLDGDMHAPRIRIGPLSVGAIHRIVTTQLGSSLTRPALLRVHAASGGNPLYALELARAALSSEDGLPRDRTPTLAELAQRRLSDLPEDARQALLLVAATSTPTPGVLSAALGADALAALRPALDVGLVELQGRTVRFSHPILTSAIYADAPEHVRRDAHARLAGTVTSVEERGHHLALATLDADDEVAAMVELAGASASRRGARADAAELFEQAADLTPERDGPARARRLVTAADSYFAVGETLRARALLERAAALDTASRHEALWRLGRILDETEGFDRTRPEWEEALRSDDLALVVHVRRSMALAGLFIDGETAIRDAVAGVDAAERLGEPRPLALALAMEAYVRGVLGDASYRDALERALPLEDDVVLEELHSPSAVQADLGRLALELDAGRRGYETVLRRAEELGDARSETWCAYGLGMVEALAGNLERASELAERAHDLSEQVTMLGLPAVRLCALVAACQGEVERCRDLVNACYVTSRQMGDKVNLLGTLAIDGFLELSLRAHADALEPLREAWTIQSELGLREPGVTRFAVDLVEALAETGQPDEAEETVDVFEHQVTELRRPWAEPLIARARGLVLDARGDHAAALAALEEAVACEDLLPMPLERARTLLALGVLQRRQRHRRAARETLQLALAIFEEVGAPLWAARARDELGRIGGRAPSAGDLTPAEQRVADLVMEGMSNKEVAAELVISVNTVESTLTSVYRKLDVRSRTELAHRLVETAERSR